MPATATDSSAEGTPRQPDRHPEALPSAEHYGFVVVHEHPVLEVPAQAFGEHQLLGVAPEAHLSVMVWPWSILMTSCSMIGPASNSGVTE